MMPSRSQIWAATLAILIPALGACASSPPPPPVRKPAPPVKQPVPVLELKPPPADRWVKVRGRNLLLKSGRLLSDVNREPFRPRVPEPWNREGAVHRATYKVCVAPDGRVRSVAILKTAGNEKIDSAFRSAIQNWRYQPTRLGPKRVPFCYPLALKARYVRPS